MATRIQLTFDTADPRRQAQFWAAALGYEPQPPPRGFASWDEFMRSEGVPQDRWNESAAIVDPESVGPRIYFQRVPEGKTAKNRVHMDLNASAPGAPLADRKAQVDAEVERLVALGASAARGPMEQDDEYWVRMNDPEGNEFCVQ